MTCRTTGANSDMYSASPPKPPSKSRRNAPHPTTRKRPRAALFPRLCRLNLHQNPTETLYIRRLENGLKRPGGRSQPTDRGLASPVSADAFLGELTRGIIGTIPASEETTNTQRFEEDSGWGTWIRTRISGVRVPAASSCLPRL